MTILAIDTASGSGSIALRRNGRTVCKLPLPASDKLGEVLFGVIEKLRNEASVSLSEIDCFAAASGPGSFTGVRVALSSAKGLAEALGKKVCGVSNLRALASFRKNRENAPTSSFGKNESLRAVALDARRGQVYAAVYDEALQLVTPEAVYTFPNWLKSLDPTSTYEFILPADNNFAGELADSPYSDMPVSEAPTSLAAAVAFCAELDGKSGLWLNPAELDANYVRRADAELSWKDREP